MSILQTKSCLKRGRESDAAAMSKEPKQEQRKTAAKQNSNTAKRYQSKTVLKQPTIAHLPSSLRYVDIFEPAISEANIIFVEEADQELEL